MPSIDTAFPSRYLRAADLDEHATTLVTIDSCSVESVGQGREAEDKLVIKFAEFPKCLILNKTNANAIAEYLDTRNYELWAGQRIGLVVRDVEYQGKSVPAIRTKRAPVVKKPSKAAAPADTPVTAPDEDDIPF